MATFNRNLGISRFAGQSVSTTTPRETTLNQVETLARQLADDIIRARDDASSRARLGRIFTTFDSVDDVLPNNIETVTRGLFAGNTGSLVNMFTSSLLTATQKTYYQEIYSTGDPVSDSNSNAELSVAYGHYAGSGSVDLTNNLNNDTPSRAIYKQYAQTLLAPNDNKFTINGSDTDSIYIITFNRARMREKLDPGNFELTLARLSGSGHANQNHTGSNVQLEGDGTYIQIIDDSSINSATVGDSGLVYNLVSGSIDGGTSVYNSSSPTYYGLLYPQHGIVILDATKLDGNPPIGVNFNTVTGSQVQGDNAVKLFTSLSGSNNLTPGGVNGGIQARSSEQVKSTYYFVRVKNAEYNYSNNPSFVTGSLGQLAYSTFINDPQTYITTVGMYNDRRELLAVAKLSQPLLKNFTRECLIKVKLDF